MNIFKITILSLFAFYINSAAAQECKQYEAQFFGIVKGVKNVFQDQGVVDCYISIDFNMDKYQPNGFCPLYPENIGEIYAAPSFCDGQYSVGQQISGYIIQDQYGNTRLDNN